MLKIDILNLYTDIVNLINKNEKYPKEFSFALYRNEKILKDIFDSIKNLRSPVSEEYKEFENKRVSIIDKYSENEIDENGNKFVYKNIDKFNEEINELLKDVKVLNKINEYNLQEIEFKNILNTEYNEEINFYKISVGSFPDNFEPKLIYQLEKIIKD